MQYSLLYRAYRRQLKTPLKMSRGVINERCGVLVRLESEAGKVSFGEVVNLPYFETETLDETLEYLKCLGPKINNSVLESMPSKMFATYFALESAMLLQDETSEIGNVNAQVLSVSYLLQPDNYKTISDLCIGLEEGYTTFKCKIGLLPILEEKERVTKLFSLLSEKESLRLDANGGLSFAEAKEWLAFCDDTKVEFLEQPLAPECIREMLQLSANYKTPIALDESVATADDLIKAWQIGWRGIYVVKPSRLGNLQKFLNWRESVLPEIVYSSALETSIGTELGLLIAASDCKNKRAIGYGVNHWFESDGFYLHPEQPKLKAGEIGVKRLEEVFLSRN